MTREKIDREFERLFENSAMRRFYDSLKIPQTKNTVIFSPKDNPNTFELNTGQLRRLCPLFKNCLTNIPFLLRREGMTVHAIDTKRALWVISHPSLTISSSIQQIKDCWIFHKIDCFLKSQSVLAKLYIELNVGQSQMAGWIRQGTHIAIERINNHWAEHKYLSTEIMRYGFSSELELGRLLLRHAHINRQSDIFEWLIVYELETERMRALKRKRRQKYDPKRYIPIPMVKLEVKSEVKVQQQHVKQQQDIKIQQKVVKIEEEQVLIKQSPLEKIKENIHKTIVCMKVEMTLVHEKFPQVELWTILQIISQIVQGIKQQQSHQKQNELFDQLKQQDSYEKVLQSKIKASLHMLQRLQKQLQSIDSK